jgi:hypothetical protein
MEQTVQSPLPLTDGDPEPYNVLPPPPEPEDDPPVSFKWGAD